MEDPLTTASIEAYEKTFGHEPKKFDFWDFGTKRCRASFSWSQNNRFWSGEYKLAHMRDERCDPNQVVQACEFYTNLIKNLPEEKAKINVFYLSNVFVLPPEGECSENFGKGLRL